MNEKHSTRLPLLGNLHLYFIVVGVFLCLISNDLFTDGFSQGSLSNTQKAQQLSTMKVTEYWQTNAIVNFSDNGYLPLGYIAESQMIRTFGSNIFYEKVISLILFLFCAFLVVYIWVLAGMTWRTGWLPLGCWLMIPLVSKTAIQNFYEMPVTLFSLLALVEILRLYNYRMRCTQYHAEHPNEPEKDMRGRSILYNFMASIWLTCAFFFKGFAGLYVIFTPLVLWFFGRKDDIGDPIKGITFMGLFTTLIISIICFFDHTMRVIVIDYFVNKISIVRSPNALVQNLSIYWMGIKQCAFSLLALLLTWIVSMKNKKFFTYLFYWKHQDELQEFEYYNIQQSYRFFTLGIFGILMLIFTNSPQEQALLPMLPMIALGSACVLHDVVIRNFQKFGYSIICIFAILAIGFTIAGLVLNFRNIGDFTGDKHLVEDVQLMIPYLHEGQTVSATPEVFEDESLKDYLRRYKRVQLDTAGNHLMLITRQSSAPSLPSHGTYVRKDIGTDRYHLYQLDLDPEWNIGRWHFHSN